MAGEGEKNMNKENEDLFQEMAEWLEMMGFTFKEVHQDEEGRYFVSNKFGTTYLPEKYQVPEIH